MYFLRFHKDSSKDSFRNFIRDAVRNSCSDFFLHPLRDSFKNYSRDFFRICSKNSPRHSSKIFPCIFFKLLLQFLKHSRRDFLPMASPRIDWKISLEISVDMLTIIFQKFFLWLIRIISWVLLQRFMQELFLIFLQDFFSEILREIFLNIIWRILRWWFVWRNPFENL